MTMLTKPKHSGAMTSHSGLSHTFAADCPECWASCSSPEDCQALPRWPLSSSRFEKWFSCCRASFGTSSRSWSLKPCWAASCGSAWSEQPFGLQSQSPAAVWKSLESFGLRFLWSSKPAFAGSCSCSASGGRCNSPAGCSPCSSTCGLDFNPWSARLEGRRGRSPS